MKDSSHLSPFSNLTLTAIALPVIALVAIMAGIFVSDASVLAKQSAADTRINADLNESYFTTDSRIAQESGLLESKSEQEQADADEEATNNEEATNGLCSNAYLQDNLRIDFNNDRIEVLKLQSFLKTYENYDYVTLSGVFDEATLRAVKAFQTRYSEDVLEPWGYQADEPTGYVYITTKKKINEIYCDEQFLLSQSEQAEIREYRQKLNTWRSQGASFETPQYLAQYYGQTTSYTQPQSSVTDGTDDSDTTTTVTDDDQATVTDDPDDTEPSDDQATTSTSTADDRGFFERLFGIGGDDQATTSTSTQEEATTTEGQDDEATTTDDEMATGTATSGIDQLATGVYNGINSIINFLLSPTFLLAVLIILILLLIATLIEGNEEEVGADDDADIVEDESTEAEVEYAETKAWTDDEDSKSKKDTTKDDETTTKSDDKTDSNSKTDTTSDDSTDSSGNRGKK